MGSKFFEELSRCLGKEQIESLSKEDRRLEIFLHGQPVLSVSPGNEVFMLPSGSKNPEANELYHRVAIAADRVFEYVEAMENTPLLRARGLDNKFHLLADFGGAVLAGRERGTGRGYEFVTWIWDYERVGVSHGHYYEDDFAGAKRDFAVRSGLIPKASLFSNEELTEIYRATDHLLAEDPNLNDKQIRAIQEARIKIEFSKSINNSCCSALTFERLYATSLSIIYSLSDSLHFSLYINGSHLPFYYKNHLSFSSTTFFQSHIAIRLWAELHQ